MRARVDIITVRCRNRTLTDCTWEQRYGIINEDANHARVYGSAGDELEAAKVRLVRGARDRLNSQGVLLERSAINFVLRGGESVDLLVTGKVSFRDAGCVCSTSGIRRRHPWVSPGPDPTARLEYTYDENSLPRSDLDHAQVLFDYPGAGRIRSSSPHRDQYRRSRRYGYRTHASFGREPVGLFFERIQPFVRGGPFVAVGGGWGSNRAIRLRAGYEVAAPPWLAFSGAVESDTTDLRVVPAISVMSNHAHIPLLPGAALGVGMPVETDRDVGIRAQAELFWYIVGLVGALDVYPSRGGTRLVGSLVGQVSF